MAQTRREFLLRAAVLCGGALTGWAAPPRADSAPARRAAVGFLATRQSPDGAWRSTRYGAFRDGDALTPLVLWSLTNAPGAETESIARGLRWLEKLTATQSARPEPWAELRYPLFTASYAAQVFAKTGDARRATFWADLVEQLRIAPALGWSADAAACGAWSDAPAPPRLPPGVSPPPDMLAPNISATVLGLAALTTTGRCARTAAALPFLAQCQNFSAAPSDPFDDGGFFFAPADSVRNKAGIAGHAAAGRERYHSYGSATCDGLLALHACGLGLDDPRLAAALAWLHRHAAGATHSGTWSPDRADERESLRYYHAQALAAALLIAALSPPLRPWATAQHQALTTDQLAAQNPDGSWAGTRPASFEDDPVIATAFALRALTPSPSASAAPDHRRGSGKPVQFIARSRKLWTDLGHSPISHVAASHDRRGRAHLQECRPRPRRRHHERVQADHRTRHPCPR